MGEWGEREMEQSKKVFFCFVLFLFLRDAGD